MIQQHSYVIPAVSLYMRAYIRVFIYAHKLFVQLMFRKTYADICVERHMQTYVYQSCDRQDV
jgi:hypothetical protein